MTPTPTPPWLSPAQRLISDISELFKRHAPATEPEQRRDLTALLRASHQLEQAQQQVTADTAAVREQMLQLLSPIQGYCSLLRAHPHDSKFADQLQALRHPLEQLVQRLEQPGEHATDVATTAAQPGRLLVIDIGPPLTGLLRRVLGEAGHELEFTAATELQTALTDHRPDLALLNTGLLRNRKDGEQCLRICQQTGVPVLVLSATGNGDLEHWLALGAEECLTAPLQPTLLTLRVRATLERKRWQERERQLRGELERNQRFIRRVFGRYLSPEIVDTLLENPDGLDLGGIRRNVTVLLTDIRGFTGLCEQLSPEHVMKLLNNYLGTMAELVLQHRGTVDEFIGDAVLAIFGAPVNRYDDTDRAIRCALAMQRAVSAINRRNRAQGLPAIAIGISLNTGPVVAGNVGSERRSKYAVVGHTVNQTARIEEICPAGRVLISAATLNAARYPLCIGTSRRLRARGITRAIHVYEVLGTTPLAPVAAVESWGAERPTLAGADGETTAHPGSTVNR